MADMPQPEPGLTRKDVEEIVEATIAGIPRSHASGGRTNSPPPWLGPEGVGEP